jgi:hypothetical protein
MKVKFNTVGDGKLQIHPGIDEQLIASMQKVALKCEWLVVY